MKFYGTKTKLYLEASFIIMYSKESTRDNLKFWYNMPNTTYSPFNNPAYASDLMMPNISD